MENHEHGHPTAPHVLAQLQDPLKFQPVAELFHQLSDPTRLRIFWLLCHRESCGVLIAQELELSAQLVAHHLRPLKESGLVCCRREGKEVYYRACETPGAQLLHRMMEQAMEISCPKTVAPGQPDLPDQMHTYLMENLHRHITIEDLSKKFLVNPTTLKEVFKGAYGTSVASHMRHHRMERSAQMLAQGDRSIAQIAQAVGYESSSKFSAAFKAHFGVVPSKYAGQAPKQPCACKCKP